MATPDYVFSGTARILAAVLPRLKRTPGAVADKTLYARYRRRIDVLAADTRAASRSVTLAGDLGNIMVGYREASADPRSVIAGLEAVVVTVRAFQPAVPRTPTLALQAQHETALMMAIEAMALGQMAAAMSAVTFRSWDEAQGYRIRLGRLFDIAIERASEARFVEMQRALRDTLALLARDLNERGRPLARIVAYETGTPLPSVVLAHALYQDAGRAHELRSENAAQHPAFMPMTGRAYSR